MGFKIEIRHLECGTWEAVDPAAPGAPIAGHGRNWKEALGDYFLNRHPEFGVKSIRVFDKGGRPHRFRSER